MQIRYDQDKHRNVAAYGLLLLAQVLLILVPPLVEDPGYDWIVTLCVTAVIFISTYIATMSRKDLVLGIVLGALCLISLWVDANIADQTWSVVALCIAITFFSYVGLKLAQKVGAKGDVDLNTILAAVTGYIFIGIIGGFLVELIEIIFPGAFSIETVHSGYSYMYFSFMTMTTVGYGDYLPLSPLGRGISILLAVTGQIYLAVVIGLIIGRYLSKP